MSEDAPSEDRDHRATTRNHRDARAAALQKALRDNLRRRKAAAAPDPAPEDKPLSGPE